MPKFGQVWFNGGPFGDHVLVAGNQKNSIHRVPLGMRVRKTIRSTNWRGTKVTDKTLIFRVRRGNGYFGAQAGVVYQDKYKYFVPSSINNAPGEPYRRQFLAAVEKWQFDLTADQKAAYNKKATTGFRMSGYNLFIRNAMKGRVQMYVDRGDPSAYDYAKTDLTIDGAWHDLALSAIVPAGAKAVFIVGHLKGASADWAIMFRKNGNTNEVVHGGMETLRANVERHRSSIVALDTARTIEYKIDNQAWITLDLAVKGWWT